MRGQGDVLGENEVQGAIVAALQVYAHEQGMSAQIFEPYANQQGDQARRFGADLIAVLDRARVVMLEVKALDVATNELVRFRPAQHTMCCQLEAMRIPLAYAFNTRNTLAYYAHPQPPQWPRLTLAAIARATPSTLPDEQPATTHPSLLAWLQKGTNVDTDGSPTLGWLLGAARGTRPRALTNAAMVLVYSVHHATVLALKVEDADRLIAIVTTLPHLPPADRATLQRLLGAQAEAFALFEPPDATPNDGAAPTDGGRPPRPQP